ncbi:MAG: DUF6391 domain-containing protein [Microcoleaceae cyanobacterium]
MTDSTWTSSSSNSSLFDFVPHPSQDTDCLKQWGFVPGLNELLKVRQVHALEHGTVWVLSEADNGTQAIQADSLGGLSTPDGFYLYGQVEMPLLQQAVQSALSRFRQGEWNLAVHPRCGTNLSVDLLLTGGLAMGINSILPKGPIEQVLGVVAAATLAHQMSPDVGRLAQQYITTSVPFNLTVDAITVAQDIWGNPAHFVKINWVE